MTPLKRTIEEFRRARREHGRDVHDPELADALRRARLRLDLESAELLRRLPFRVRRVTPAGHLAVDQEVHLREGRRFRGQTLCGAESGRPTFGNPAPCPACLLAAERYLTEGPPPLELELGA